MSQKFYLLDEYMDSLIVDSEGLIFGRGCGYEYYSSGVRIKVCIEVKAQRVIPNRDKLVEILRHRGVDIPVDATLEFLVVRAREEGLDIPLIEVTSDIKIVKSYIDPSEIYLVDRMPDARLLVLLSSPREALFRGISLQEEIPPPSPDLVEGKIVVSLSRGLIGFAQSIVLGPKEAGIRVAQTGRGEFYFAWLAYLSEVKKRGYTKIYSKLAEYADPYKKKRLPLEALREVEDILVREDAPRDLIELIGKYIKSESIGVFIDLPWSSIKKLRDVIIVE